MVYTSTRDAGVNVFAAEAIVRGLAPGGGLFVPTKMPRITGARLSEMVSFDYLGRARGILGDFLPDFTAGEIDDIVLKAYGGGSFEDSGIAPVRKLSDELYVLELWHGPTCAFKDMALQMLPHLITKALEKIGGGGTLAVLTATSGDTGKAALEGFRDVSGTKIIVFYPENGVSHTQELQMVTQEGENVLVLAVKGNFDDAQNGVKEIFADGELGKKLLEKGILLSSANSINWGRLMPQIVYYFSAYCDLIKTGEIRAGDEVDFVVPTGNFGNILAAYYAKLMGLPVGRLVCASNKNNVLTEFINSGVYNRNRDFYATKSPSMDILISSNLERFLYHVSGGDHEAVGSYMRALRDSGKYEVCAEVREKMQGLLWGGHCDDEDTFKTIAAAYKKYGYVLDPHTAVGMNVYEQYRGGAKAERKTILVSTASPFKFSSTVYFALSGEDEGDELGAVKKLAGEYGLRVPPSIEALWQKPRRFERGVRKEDMKSLIAKELLG